MPSSSIPHVGAALVTVGLAGLLHLLSGGIGPAHAIWSSFPDVETPVCVADDDQTEPRFLSAGDSGLFAVWRDRRDGTSTQSGLRVQWLDDDGNPGWDPDGVRVSLTPASTYSGVDLVSDGAGGVIVAWADTRYGDFDVFAQRIGAGGQRLWGDDGLPVAVEDARQRRVAAVPDGVGGVYVAWDDTRRSFHSDIYLQRIDADGTALFTPSGLEVSADGIVERHVAITPDGAGGVILAWSRSDVGVQAARVGPTGTLGFGGTTIAVASGVSSSTNPFLVPDGVGGAVVAWMVSNDLGAQRIDAGGTRLWNGGTDVEVSQSEGSKTNLALASAGDGGAFLAWYEFAGSDRTARAQRLTATGARAWSDTARVLGPSATSGRVGIVPDGSGSALATWSEPGGEVLARKLRADGTPDWTPHDVVVSNLAGQVQELQAVGTADGGMIVGFERPSGSDDDVLAQRVLADGYLGGILSVGTWGPSARPLLAVHPVPFRTGTTITVEVEAAGATRVEVIDVAGRRVRTLLDGSRSEGRHLVTWDGRDHRGRTLPAGTYYVTAATPTGREVRPVVTLP